MRFISIEKKLKQFGERFTAAGFHCFLVGGAVRNRLAGLPPSDYDFTTDATPEQMMELFPRTFPTGIQHGTLTLFFKGEAFEVTTFRLEGRYSDHRHPDSVQFSTHIHEDLSRRDFTVNAIAADLRTGELIDPFDGQGDLRRRRLKAIGNPTERFLEDALRILRLFRFHASLGFDIDPETLAAAAKTGDRLAHVSFERIRDEWNKILLTPNACETLRLMQENGILAQIVPELSACAGVEQNRYHRWDVFEHSLQTLAAMQRLTPLPKKANSAAGKQPKTIGKDGHGTQPEPAAEDRTKNATPGTGGESPGKAAADTEISESERLLRLRLAALLHDIGKPACIGENGGERTFYRHEQKSAHMAQILLTRLKFPNRSVQWICHLIEQHMFLYTSDWSDKAVRRWIKRVGIDCIHPLLQLAQADRWAHFGRAGDWSDFTELLTRAETVLARGDALSLKELAVNGNDLMALGIPEGPFIRILLNQLLDAVLEDPENNQRERLLTIAQRLKPIVLSEKKH